FIAQVAEFDGSFSIVAKRGQRFFSRGALRRILLRRSESFKNGNRLGVAQRAQGIQGGQLDGAPFVVGVLEEEFAHGIFLLLFAGEVSQSFKSAGEGARRKFLLPLLQGG